LTIRKSPQNQQINISLSYPFRGKIRERDIVLGQIVQPKRNGRSINRKGNTTMIQAIMITLITSPVWVPLAVIGWEIFRLIKPAK